MPEILITAAGDLPRDVIAVIRDVLDDIGDVVYMPGCPRDATWTASGSSGAHVRVTLNGDRP